MQCWCYLLTFFSLVPAVRAKKTPMVVVGDFTYLSQYIAHGLDLSNGSPVWQTTVIVTTINGMRRGQLCGIRTRFFSDTDYALEGFASAYYPKLFHHLRFAPSEVGTQGHNKGQRTVASH